MLLLVEMLLLSPVLLLSPMLLQLLGSGSRVTDLHCSCCLS